MENCSNFFIFFCVVLTNYFIGKIRINNVTQCLQYIISFFILLLYCIYQFFLNKLTLQLEWHISWTYSQKVHLGARIHSPSYLFFNIDTHLQRLVQRHLAIFTLIRITATLWSTFCFHFDAFTLGLFCRTLPKSRISIQGFNFCAFVTAFSLTFSLFIGIHDILNSFSLFCLMWLNFLRFWIFIINSRYFNLIIINFMILSLGRLIKFIVPYFVVTSANTTIINLIIYQKTVVIFNPFFMKLFFFALAYFLSVNQEISKIYFSKVVFTSQSNSIGHKCFQIAKQTFKVMVVGISELIVDLLQTL